jgi:hypothetical protein
MKFIPIIKDLKQIKHLCDIGQNTMASIRLGSLVKEIEELESKNNLWDEILKDKK